MKNYSYGFYIILLACFSFVMVSCNSGRKFNYASAYKFQLPERYQAEKKNEKVAYSKVEAGKANSLDSLTEAPDQLLVSSENVIVLPKRTVKPFHAMTSASEKSPAAAVDVRKTSETGKATSFLTVKEIRKEIRVGFKKYRNEIKERQKISGVEKAHDGRVGKGILLVLLGIGVIVAGILLVEPIGVLLGSLIAALGLILFLIGLLGLIL